MHCFTAQPVGQCCQSQSCNGRLLAKYFCEPCRMFSDSDKPIYHCNDCGMCRTGNRASYTHCHKCCSCIENSEIGDHHCLENGLHSNCPICAEDMFTSVQPVFILNCGHCIHEHCLKEYISYDYKCPICLKSIGDMSQRWTQLDEYIDANPMPVEYANRMATVLCHDCGDRSEAPSHFLYHKCRCGSYNTVQVGPNSVD